MLTARIEDLGPTPGASARIARDAGQLASTRVYLGDNGVVYVAFYDASEHVKSYACFIRASD